MPKPYLVTPHRNEEGTSYAAVFRNSMGVRIHRGLGTEDQAEAGLISAGLVRLWTAKVKNAGEVPADVPLKAVRLYFGEMNKPEVVHERVENLNLADIRSEVNKYPKPCREILTIVFIERAKLRRENDTLRIDLTSTRLALEESLRKYRNLETSIIGRASIAGERAIPLFEALAEYYRFIHTKTDRDNARSHVTMACTFVLTLPDSVRTIADVDRAQVCSFMDGQCETAKPRKRLTRRRKVREVLGRFVNWACQQCELPSIMAAIEATSKNEVLRERGDIHWHDLKEVKSVISKIKSDYWKTVVSALAYSGLQLAELCWLRVKDVEWLPNGTAQFWITTVEDPDDDRVGHTIKTEHRRRHVRLHPKLLQPLIRKHIDSGRAGETFLFAMPPEVHRRTRTVNGGSAERWQIDTLSTVLRGHKGGKKRKPTPGILPSGMNAKSLRRTFGSLLLRSGKTSAEVAAAMGNDEKTVRQHYAKLKGCEVSMDF